MGASGSGKSTLLNLVSGVLTAEHGSAKIDGADIQGLSSKMRDRLRAEKIGYIFQQFNLIPYLSAIENVLLSCRFSPARAAAAQQRHGSQRDSALSLLTGFFPNQNLDFDRAVTALSVGQQQRVAAARALIGAPSLVIADEPTSALDHDTKARFMELLVQESDRQNSTLLFVSHDPTLTNHFHRMIRIEDINSAVIG